MLDSVFKRLPIKECYFVTDTTSNFKVVLLQKENSTDIDIFIDKPHYSVSKLRRHALCRILQCKDVGQRRTASRTLQILFALKECKKKSNSGISHMSEQFLFFKQSSKDVLYAKHHTFIH